MPSLTDITERLAGALRFGTRRTHDPETHLTGRHPSQGAPVGGVWRGTMIAGELQMQVLVTVRNTPPAGSATWHATGVSQQAWDATRYDTNLGPVVVKSHCFNPQGHYYELEGFGDVEQLTAAAVH